VSDSSIEQLDPRSRLSRPERIPLGDDVGIRDDIMAAQLGVITKTLSSYDRDGAPYLMVGNVKYRPERAFNEYLRSRIKVKGRPQRARSRSRSSSKK
jgi:hypothetical protein